MNRRLHRKLAAAEHQKQRELLDKLHQLRLECFKKHGVMLQTYCFSAERAIAEYEGVLSGAKPMPKRDVRLSVGLASLMAASLGGVA